MPTPSARGFLLTAHPAYGWFWCARVCSSMAFQIQAVTVGWQVYALTQSTFQLGLVGLVQFLPIVLFTLPSGHLADRYDRRVLYGAGLALQGLAGTLLAVGTYGHWLGVAGIYVLIALIGTARSFQFPASQALMPTLLPTELVPKGIAWSSGAFQTASIVGPSIGGFLYALGPQVPYAVAAGFSLGAASFMLLVHQEHAARPKEPATLQSIFSGFRYIWTHPIILGSISLDLFAVLLGGATALLPVFAKDILAVGAIGLGWLRAAPAVGSLVMSVYLARRPPHRRVGPKMFLAVIGFGVTTIVFGLSRSFALSFVTLVLLGAVDTISVVIRSSMVQLETPNEMRGRVGAVNSLFIGTSNQLGEFESGITASWFGAVRATVLGGIGTLVVAGLWMRLFPALSSFDAFEKKKEAPSAGPSAA